jgi:hypothetical protein
VRAQIEGGTLFGMYMTLNEQLTVKDGIVAERNFNQYWLLRINDRLPVINSISMLSPIMIVSTSLARRRSDLSDRQSATRSSRLRASACAVLRFGVST